MPHETQQTITDWADETFGPVEAWESAAHRSVEEMEEFIRFYDDPDSNSPEGLLDDTSAANELMNEAADIVITLYRLASVVNRDLHTEIDRKMSINRARKWRRDGTGHGYHIKED